MKSRSLLVVAVLASWVGLANPAHAGDFQASPVRVHLDGRSRSALVTLSNGGPTALRLQVDTFAWAEDSDGKQVLGPTSDLVVFPTLLELGPGETRAIRVGTTSTPERRERTYRLLIEELPSDDPGHLGVNLLMRMSIPVFVTDPRAREDLRIGTPALTSDTLTFSLENKGDRHVKPHQLIVALTTSDGQDLIEKVTGWYVLAGQARNYRMPRSTKACIKSVKIRIEDGERALERTEPLTDPSCATRPGRE